MRIAENHMSQDEWSYTALQSISAPRPDPLSPGIFHKAEKNAVEIQKSVLDTIVFEP